MSDAPKHVSTIATVKYDLSPAEHDTAIQLALIKLGWTPPSSEKENTHDVAELISALSAYRNLVIRIKDVFTRAENGGKGLSFAEWQDWQSDAKDALAKWGYKK